MQLRYGQSVIDAPIEALDPFIVEKKWDNRTGESETPGQRLLQALDAANFDAFIRTGDKVTIVIPDKTRYAKAEALLPPLLDALNGLGVADGAIEIVFALGIHPPQTEEERLKILGPAAARRVSYFDHDAKRAEFVNLGQTRNGTPVMINRRVYERDKIITLGTITYHYFAGFGGGRKMFIPGVANAETCRFNHILALTETGRHPDSRAGKLDGNPIYDDGIEAFRRIDRPIFSINAVLSPAKELLAIYCGGVVEAHKAACEFYDGHFRVAIPGPFDAAIVSAGGAPKDINWIQSHKSVEMAFQAIRPGGSILALLECPQGPGHDDFLRWFDYPTLGDMRRALGERYQIYGQTAWNSRFKAQQCDIFLLSALPDEIVRKMEMHPVASIEEGLARLRKKHGANLHPIVFPYGATFLPVQGKN